MKKRNYLWSVLALLMAGPLSAGLTSCGEEWNWDDYEPKPPLNVTDDDGVPGGAPGDESMFGIYSCLGTNSAIWNSYKNTAETNVKLHQGDFNEWWGNYFFDGEAIWIADEHTIYWVDDYISFSQSRPTSDDESILLESEQYTFKYTKYVVSRPHEYTANYYLTHYIYKWPKTNRWEGRYAMNGSQMVIHTDETTKWVDGREVVAVDYNTLTWDYSNGTIDVDGVKYTKIN